MQLVLHGIISYPTMFQARKADANSDPKFSVNVLIPKGDPQIAQIQQGIAEQITAGLNGVNPSADKTCLKDCAVQYPDKPELVGYMEVRCSSGEQNKPHVVDMARQPVLDPSLVYGGAMAHVAINIAAYNLPLSKGITAYVNGIMLTGVDGALGRLDNRQSAEGLFQTVTGTAPAAATAPPAAAQVAAAPAPAAPAPAPAPAAPPVAAAPPTPPAAPVHQMTAAANGQTYEAFIAAGWNDEQLIAQGIMLPPGGVGTSF